MMSDLIRHGQDIGGSKYEEMTHPERRRKYKLQAGRIKSGLDPRPAGIFPQRGQARMTFMAKSQESSERISRTVPKLPPLRRLRIVHWTPEGSEMRALIAKRECLL
jgi:hypothetical protein